MVRWFQEISAKDLNIAGGKGANLGEMTKAGFPVPPGFCITVEAYRRHLKDSNLWSKIEILLTELNSEDIPKLDKTAEDIRTMIEQSPMPEVVKLQVKEAYAKLSKDGCPRVAVRSSATAEDLPEASFAGQQETFLSIQGETEVLKSVQKCWASLWTGRSIAYRNRNGFDHKEVSLAVVVQGMIESEKSGVLFTVNPLTGDRKEMLINASYGLGESIVAGKVTPDLYRISKKGRLLLERQLGTKATLIQSKPDGATVTEEVAQIDRERFCLQPSELKELQKMGLLIENHYRTPQDIEWAIADGRLYLLQTRPVTSMGQEHAVVVKKRKFSKIQIQEYMNYKEHVSSPPCPLEYETMLELIEEKHRAFRSLGLYVPAAERIISLDANGIPSLNPFAPRPTLRIIFAPFYIRRLLHLNATDASKQEELELEQKLKELKAADLSSLNDQALADYINRVMELVVIFGRIRFMVYVFPMVMLGAWLKVLIRFSRVPFQVSEYDLLASLDYKTAMIDKALHGLAVMADSLPKVKKIITELPADQVYVELQTSPEGKGFLKGMDAFLKEHGARTMKAYMPFSNLTSWSENPSILLTTICTILRSEDISNYEERFKEAGEKFQKLKNDITKSIPGFLRSNFIKTLEQFRNAFKGRELTLHGIEDCYVVLRRGTNDAGLRLMKRGYLSKPDDLPYFTLSELCGILKQAVDPAVVSQNVLRRKQHRHKAVAVWNADNPDLTGNKGVLLKGLPSSQGVITGTVKIINGPSEFGKLQKGDVLVCSFTDPSWTPLFALACGVISDTGGPLSHAAIVAREYSIPAVLGTKVATIKLKDGDRVTVNGTKGIVHLETKSPEIQKGNVAFA